MKAFLFDLDGTLVDRDSGARDWLQQKFRPFLPPSQLDSFNSRFLELDTQWRRDKPKLFALLASEYDLGASETELLNDYRENVWRYCELYPGVKSTLESLRAPFRLAIISNGTTRCQGAKIVGLGLRQLVDIVLISETEGSRKPDPQLFLRAAQRLEVLPEQCFVVGDSISDDIVGGKAAGMSTIWIEQEEGWPTDIAIRPDFTVASLADLPALLA